MEESQVASIVGFISSMSSTCLPLAWLVGTLECASPDQQPSAQQEFWLLLSSNMGTEGWYQGATVLSGNSQQQLLLLRFTQLS
jgi:hypothetical protein